MLIIFMIKRFSNDLEVKSLKLCLYCILIRQLTFIPTVKVHQPHLILRHSYKHRIILRAYKLTKVLKKQLKLFIFPKHYYCNWQIHNF